MEIRLCPRCSRADAAPATRCRDCDVPLQVHDEGWLIGSVLGNYTLERVLGAGGMGVVFAARHQSLLREAAIKMLQPELDARASGGNEFAQRFLREARLLATLEHPNIVGIYDFDLSAWGFPYLVMPRLRGETLRQLLNRHPHGLPLAWIALIATDIAAGLAHAHRHGVVHRDLKPENVFLALESDGARAKLLDFGIAHAAADADFSRTATGTLMGTPLYQAPEQLRGETVSAATDQYSYALLHAEMLRGAAVRQGRSLTDILFHDSQAALPADALPQGIDAATTAALSRATAPDPAARFADMAELLAALALVPARRDELAPAIDDGSSSSAFTVVVAAPPDRRSPTPLAPTTPPPAAAARNNSTPALTVAPTRDRGTAPETGPQQLPRSAVTAERQRNSLQADGVTDRADAAAMSQNQQTGKIPDDATGHETPRSGRNHAPRRSPHRWLLLGALALLGAIGLTAYRYHAAGSAAAGATASAAKDWLREAERRSLPPGLLAPLTEARGNLLLRSAGGWTLFDPASGSAGAGAALGVAEYLLGVDDRQRLWVTHDGVIETLLPAENRRETVVTGSPLLADADAQTRWALAASGRWLARLDADGRLRIFRLQNGKVETWLEQRGTPNEATRLALGDRYAVIVRPNAQVEVFALEARRSAWQAGFAPFRVRALAVSEELDRLAVAGDGEHLAIWQLADGTPVAAPQPQRELRSLLWLRDGGRLLAADATALSLWRWPHSSPQPVQELNLPGGADWLYRGARAIYAGSARDLVRYDFGTAPARQYAAGIGNTWALAAGSAAIYAGGSAGGELVSLDRTAGAPLRRKVHNAGITDLQVFNDRLVSSSDDRTIAVWRLPELELEWRAKGHEFLINQIAIGRSLWSSSSDGSLRRWRWPELEAAETIDLRPRLSPELELHGLRVFGAGDEEILAGSWNYRLLQLRRNGERWDLRSALFEAQTGYRLVDLPQLDAVLVAGLNPGRLGVIDRRHSRLELLPRDAAEWHAAVAGDDGRSAWLGGNAQIARLSLRRRDDGRFEVDSRIHESSHYGEIGALALLPAHGDDGATLAFGDENGRLMLLPLQDLPDTPPITTLSEQGPAFVPP